MWQEWATSFYFKINIGVNMEEREKLILDFMKDKQYVPMKAKEMASILEVPKEDYREFTLLLAKLEKEYFIQKSRKGKYSLIEEERFQKGIFHANEKGFGFVQIKDKEEIYIAKNRTNGALNEDELLVEILKESENKNREGKVVSILKHARTTLVGTFQNHKTFGFVVPDDRKFGTDIYIPKKYFLGAHTNDKVVVQLTQFLEKGKSAEGKIIEVLGKVDETGVDMLSLVKEYSLPYEFPKPVLEEAKSIKEHILKKEIPHRLDLRNKEIFTIDGEDAKDLDDAVFVEELENGNYRLGVCIADVSYYVKENSKLDKEAFLRGTSVYMLDRVIPMLPKELSNGVCSLNAGKDRLALSVIMEIDKQGKVVSSNIQKAIICVTKRMSYHEVSVLLDSIEGKKIAEEQKKIVEDNKNYLAHFERMAKCAKILKIRREKQGSLNLEIPESKLLLDENGYVLDIKPYEITFANEIIEQFMLTANETVAEQFYWLEAPFIYRVHEEPDENKIKELNAFLYNLGYHVKTSKDNIHPKAFAEVLVRIKGKEEEQVISHFILHTLKVARYESENKGHFGIASKCYCHFTSPIRRYPDLFIHRIISHYIDKDYSVEEDWKEKEQALAIKAAEQSSEREKVAKEVERESVDMKMAEYMEGKIGEIYEGIVSSITSFGMFVELANTVEGLIRFEHMGEDYFFYDENKKMLIGERTKKMYHIGDKVTIRVIDANKSLRRIDFELLEDKTN